MGNFKKQFVGATSLLRRGKRVLNSKGEVVDFVLSAQQKGGLDKAGAIRSVAKALHDTWTAAELRPMSFESLLRIENKVKKTKAGYVEALIVEHGERVREFDVDFNKRGELPAEYALWCNSLFDITDRSILPLVSTISDELRTSLTNNNLYKLPGTSVELDLYFYFDQLKGAKESKLSIAPGVSPEKVSEEKRKAESEERSARLRNAQLSGPVNDYVRPGAGEDEWQPAERPSVRAPPESPSSDSPSRPPSLGPLLSSAPTLSDLRSAILVNIEELRRELVAESPEADVWEFLGAPVRLVPLRGRGEGVVNPDFVESWVEAVSSNPSVGARSVANIFVSAGKVCGQAWVTPWHELAGTKRKRKQKRKRHPASPASVVEEPPAEAVVDKQYVIPARSTMSIKLEEAAYLNLEYAAKAVADDGNIITWGMDEVTKQTTTAKVDNVTSVDKATGKARDYTTGILEMPAKDAPAQRAATDHRLDLLAILMGVREDGKAEYTKKEMLESIDFFMADREAACNLMLREYTLESDKVPRKGKLKTQSEIHRTKKRRSNRRCFIGITENFSFEAPLCRHKFSENQKKFQIFRLRL